MKHTWSFIIFVVGLVALVVLSFTYVQASQEKKQLSDDLQRRTSLLADSFRESIQPYVRSKDNQQVQRVVDKFTNRQRIVGLVVYDNKDSIIAQSDGISDLLPKISEAAVTAMDRNQSYSVFDSDKNNSQVFFSAVPLHSDGSNSVTGSLVIAQNASYIDSSVIDTWKNGLLRVLSYAIFISIALSFLVYWFFSRPIVNLVETIQSLRSGKQTLSSDLIGNRLFGPLINEFSSIHTSLLEARTAASYEARLRIEKLDSPWTAERLKEFTKETLKNKPLFVVSNREPYIHTKRNGKIAVIQPASGMVTAIEPMMMASGGVWVAHGSGDADAEVVDKHDRVMIPPADPQFALSRVWLTEAEEKGYYYGFSNDGLWPLCHIAHVEPIFRKDDWRAYQEVNQKFAKKILQEIKDVRKPLIFIQDYHFTLLPALIKSKRPDAVIAVFWHIPWPSSESFRICPWKNEILTGMLGADLLAFHTQLHANNFIETVGKEVESLIDLEQFAVQRGGHISYVKPFPIGIPYPHDKQSEGFEQGFSKVQKEQFLREIGVPFTQYIGVGVDRMDYTKGILERLRAIDLFLKKYPQYREKFTFLQVAPSTRATIPSYLKYSQEVVQEIERVNNMYKTKHWKPIVLFNKHQSHEMLQKFYKLGDICLVTSLHDGMNLVAMEYAAARVDERGVLILSQFTGASRELRDALIVNPYDVDDVADSIKVGLEMSETDQRRRMRRLRLTVENNNVYRWAAEILKEMVSIRTRMLIKLS